jgi:hypothetical protein
MSPANIQAKNLSSVNGLNWGSCRVLERDSDTTPSDWQNEELEAG